jgi:hypothetical protein
LGRHSFGLSLGKSCRRSVSGMLGDKTVDLCKVLQQIMDNESMVDPKLECSIEFVRDVIMDESFYKEFVYDCIGEVRRVV